MQLQSLRNYKLYKYIKPCVLPGAGLVAKKAIEKGLKVPEYVKTSLAPGSKVVTEYLDKSGLTTYLTD